MLKENSLSKIFLIASDRVKNTFVPAETEFGKPNHLDFLKRRIVKEFPCLEDKFVELDYSDDAELEINISQIAEIADAVTNYAKNFPEEKIIVHADMTGGFRHTSMLMLSVIQILKYRGIETGKILYSDPDKKIVYPANEIQKVFTLITGADEFIKFGSVEALQEYFGKNPVVDDKVLNFLEERAKSRGFGKLSDGMKKQAIVPSDSLILYNHHGTAPGCVMERDDGKICILLPGPPHEMQPMFEECCEFYLNAKSDKILVSIIIKCLSKDVAPISIVGESPVADRLAEILDGINPTVATYAKEDGCIVRVTAAGKNHDEALKILNPVVKKCRERIGEEYINYIKEDID